MEINSSSVFTTLKLICGLTWVIIFTLEYKKNKLNKNIYIILLGLTIFLSGCYDIFKIYL